MTTAIILASGNGSRLDSITPKQFLKINRRRILDYSIQTFLDCLMIELSISGIGVIIEIVFNLIIPP